MRISALLDGEMPPEREAYILISVISRTGQSTVTALVIDGEGELVSLGPYNFKSAIEREAESWAMEAAERLWVKFPAPVYLRRVWNH